MQTDPEAKPQDLLAASRQSLLDAHIIHDFRLARVKDNLAGCYGILIGKVYRDLLSLLKGGRVIDCGCGFGQFSRVALDAGFEVTSVDIDEASLALARDISHIPCRRESVYATSLPDNSCDSAVCCDSIQHFDIPRLAPELSRLGVRRIVIYDSNISNPFLAGYRALAGHRESHDRTAAAIAQELGRHGYDLAALRYENVVALPISGGLQRAPAPLLHRFPDAVQTVDRLLTRGLRLLRLDRVLSFRFLMVLDRRESPPPEHGR